MTFPMRCVPLPGSVGWRRTIDAGPAGAQPSARRARGGSSEIPLNQLRSVDPSRHRFNTADFVSVHTGRVPVLIRRGFAEFVAEVQAAAPHVTVTSNRYSRMVERLPGSSGFRRDASGGG